MYFHDLIDTVTRFLNRGRSRRPLLGGPRTKLVLEELEARTVPNAAPPTGLVTVIGDDGPKLVDGSYQVSLTNFNQQLATIFNPNISGVALQIQWSDIEPNQPANPDMPTASELTLGRLKLLFKDANEAGKWVQLLIAPGFWSPQWVLNSSITAPFEPQYDNPKDDSLGLLPLPVPWDSANTNTYYAYWFGFLTEIENLYGTNAEFRSIGAAGPTSVSAEATMPSSTTTDPKNPAYPSDLAEWDAYGYQDYGFTAPSNYITSWTPVFQFYANTFTNQYVALSAGPGISNPANDPTYTLQQLVNDGSGIVNDFPGQFSFESFSLTSDGAAVYLTHQLVIGYNGNLTTGFQIADSDEKLGAENNLPLDLALVMQNGMLLNAEDQHTNYIEIFARDVEPTDVTRADPIPDDPALLAVLQWGASLFDSGTLSVFGDQTLTAQTFPDQTITVATDPAGGLMLTIDGNSVPFMAGQFASINIYNTENNANGPVPYDTTINIENTNVPVTITDLPAAISASKFSASEDDVTIGNSSTGVQGIDAHVSITGSAPSTNLTIDDAGDTTSPVYTLTSGRLTGPSPAPISWDDSNIDALTIDGGSGNSTYGIDSTPAATTIDAGTGNNTIDVSPTDKNLQSLGGLLTVNAVPGGANTLNVDDQQYATKATTYTVTSTAITRSGTNNSIYYSGMQNIVLNGGGGKGNTIDVQNTAAGTSTTVNAGTGSDTIEVANADNLNAILGALAVHRQGGSNTLDINDQASTRAQTYALSATTLTRSGAAAITFGSSLSVVVNAGSGSDTFAVAAMPVADVTLVGGAAPTNFLTGPDIASTWSLEGSNGGILTATGNSATKVDFTRVENLTGGDAGNDFAFQKGASIGTINGGAGVNQLDYSAYQASVVVDLLIGLATGTIGISNIQEVDGSGRGDVLVGDGTGVKLVETTGNNLIIGGAGGDDTLDSGSGQDIVIAGSTIYDDNYAALVYIERFWSMTGNTFAFRVAALSGVTPIHLAYRLNTSTVSHNATTGDTIDLGSATDWVFWRMSGAGADTLSGTPEQSTLI